MAIAEWKYPFPSRTRKSSALTPMVLRKRGRVGSRQALFFALRRPAGASLRPFVRSRARSTVSALPPCAASRIPWSILPASCAHGFVALFGVVHRALPPSSLLPLDKASFGGTSLHHAQCIRGRSVASVASVVVVASVVSVTFVPSVASVVHARCPLLERTSKCGQFFVRFSPKNKNADIPLVDGAAF